jgi:hypothetical protein
MTSLLQHHVQQYLAHTVSRVPSAPGPLAPPPPGSGLEAVPGDPGAP